MVWKSTPVKGRGISEFHGRKIPVSLYESGSFLIPSPEALKSTKTGQLWSPKSLVNNVYFEVNKC